MHRLSLPKAIQLILVATLLLTGASFLPSCAQVKPVVRDQLVVEKLRLRITKVRHAIAETRNVIAASRGADYLPEMYMRLAELLSEEARYHYMVAYEREQKSTKSLHVPQVRFLKEQAIGTYKDILTKYPLCHLNDRILFNISHENRELGEFDEMKKYLEKLITDYPDSPYHSEALLVLGDYYFDKMEFKVTADYYKKITAKKKDLLRGLALYKMGWVEVNLGNCKSALKNFEDSINVSKEIKEREKLSASENVSVSHPEGEFAIPTDDKEHQQFAGHKTVNVQREALVDLTYCYAQQRKPEKAVEYLKGLASTRDAYVAALSKMASRYALIEQPKGAADVCRELLRLAPDDIERLDDARMLHVAVTKMKDYSSVGEDVSLILSVMQRQLLQPDIETNNAKLIKSEFELITRDLSTKAHSVWSNRETTQSVWTKNPVSASETAKAYLSYLHGIPDSPQRLDIVQNLADILMEDKQYLNAGHWYREAAALLEKPPIIESEADPRDKTEKTDKAKADKADKADKKTNQQKTEKQLIAERKKARYTALYNAVVAYQKSLESEGTRGHFERATARAGLRKAGGIYLAGDKPDKEIEIKFAIAQSFYDEGSYIDAIDLLTAIAYEYPTTKQGDAAVHMVLDSYMTINDITGLITSGTRFMHKQSPVSAAIKAQIAPIVAAGEQNRLDELSLAASGEQVGGMEVLLAFADRYKNSGLGERAMLSAFVAARASGDTTKLYELGEKVLKTFPKSEQLGGVLSTMGRAAATRFEFSRAIDYLERAAAIDQEQQVSLLIAAGELKEQLSDTAGALNDYQKAQTAAGEGPRRSEVLIHIADLIEKQGNYNKITTLLSPYANPDDPEISVRYGTALLKTGQYEASEEQFRNVVDGAGAATATSQAKANYGLAEVMMNLLETYELPDSIDVIEELVGVIDVVLQTYLAAARQPDATYSQAALSRMARAAEVGANKLDQIKLPSELSQEEKTAVKAALAGRATQLRSDAKAILAECAQRAKDLFLLDDVGQTCINQVAPTKDLVKITQLSSRNKVNKLDATAKEARDRLAKNAEDIDALRTLGKAFLDGGDAHSARLVLMRAVETGGESEDLNLLGIASYRAGDISGAFDAFKRAKEAGSNAAAKNLVYMCNKKGLKKYATALDKAIQGDVKGRLLSQSKGGGR